MHEILTIFDVVFLLHLGLIKVSIIFTSLIGTTKRDIWIPIKTKESQTTWTFCFPAGTIFSWLAITVVTTIFRGRGVTISFSKLHASTTRYTASWIIRPFPKSTIYRTWLDRTFTCFIPVTNTICATICWSWVVTFS